MSEGQSSSCERCGGKRTVLDVAPGVDPITVYPEQMPCPKCTDGTWADAVRTVSPSPELDKLTEQSLFHKRQWHQEGARAERLQNENRSLADALESAQAEIARLTEMLREARDAFKFRALGDAVRDQLTERIDATLRGNQP